MSLVVILAEGRTLVETPSAADILRAMRAAAPGSAQAFMSAEDELTARYLPKPLRQILVRSLGRGLPGAGRLASAAFGLAQRQAQKLAFQQRQSVLRADTWLEEALSFSRPVV